MITHGTVSAVIVESSKVTEISCQKIKGSYSTFRGANLVMAAVEDVSIIICSSYIVYLIMILTRNFSLLSQNLHTIA